MESKSVHARGSLNRISYPYFPEAISTSPISYLIKLLLGLASDFFPRSLHRFAASLSLTAAKSE